MAKACFKAYTHLRGLCKTGQVFSGHGGKKLQECVRRSQIPPPSGVGMTRTIEDRRGGVPCWESQSDWLVEHRRIICCPRNPPALPHVTPNSPHVTPRRLVIPKPNAAE